MQAKASIKCRFIKEITERDNNLLNISWLCSTAGVSRSGYYQWLNAADARNLKTEQDRRDFEMILSAYRFRGYDKGSCGIHMRLLNQGIRMNRKKYPEEIRRIIYTTSITEGLHRQIRKVTKSKTIFPSDSALEKMLYLSSKNVIKKWTQRCRNCDQVLNHLMIMFENQVTKYI